MFTCKICLATVLLSLHLVHSYILLTANLDDVHSLAKQIAESPVVNQINDIIRRATSTFNNHNQDKDRKQNSEYIHKRSDPELDEDYQKPKVPKRKPQYNHKRSDPELDENYQKQKVQKHNQEYSLKQSYPELDKNYQKPEIRKHNPEYSLKPSNFKWDEDTQKPEVRKHNPEYSPKRFYPELDGFDDDYQKPEVPKRKPEQIPKRSNPDLDNDTLKPVIRKHNPEYTPKRSYTELDEGYQNPKVSKQNPERIPKRSNPELDDDPQMNKRQNSLEIAEENLPHPIEEDRLDTDAAPADADDVDVWNPDSKAVMKELVSEPSSEGSEENDVKPLRSKAETRRSSDVADVVELGRNASFYLTSIKKIFENV